MSDKPEKKPVPVVKTIRKIVKKAREKKKLNNKNITVKSFKRNLEGFALDWSILTPGVLAAAGYGGDKAIFGYGSAVSASSLTNLVSNTGVVSADVTGVGTARSDLAAASYSS